MDYLQQYKDMQHCIERSLERMLASEMALPALLLSAMRYTLLAGGKRLRPVLTLAAGELIGVPWDETMPIACGVEMLHTYSLIHDDLPGMDNDDYRRGKPTCHKQFGEGIAILSGDGLHAYAMELMVSFTLADSAAMPRRLRAVNAVLHGAGLFGMIAGQCEDLQGEGKQLDAAQMASMHCKKTGALIVASLLGGLYCGQSDGLQEDALRQYGQHLGLAFQITDDILDVEGEMEIMGKRAGKDAQKNKSTYPHLFGLEASKRMVRDEIEKACCALELFGDCKQFLSQLAWSLENRSK